MGFSSTEEVDRFIHEIEPNSLSEGKFGPATDQVPPQGLIPRARLKPLIDTLRKWNPELPDEQQFIALTIVDALDFWGSKRRVNRRSRQEIVQAALVIAQSDWKCPEQFYAGQVIDRSFGLFGAMGREARIVLPALIEGRSPGSELAHEILAILQDDEEMMEAIRRLAAEDEAKLQRRKGSRAAGARKS